MNPVTHTPPAPAAAHDYLRIYKTEAGYHAVRAWYDDAVARFPIATESHTVETRYGTTHMLTCGDPAAPPLVLVSGFGGSAPLWHKQIADMAANFRVYALDTVGHPGRSAPNPPPLMDDGYALWLLDVFDALRLERAHVMGVCLGGWVAMRFAVLYRERVEKLVLLSPVGLAPFRIYWRSGVPLILNIGSERRLRAAGERLLVRAFTPPGSNLRFDRHLARALTLAMQHFRLGVVVGFAGARPTPRELWHSTRILGRFVMGESRRALARITAPTLLLVGEHEAIYDPYTAFRRASAIPQAEVAIVPETGHAAIYDRPEFVNPRIVAFLSRPPG
jgi:pimeloyl-ACP methyl ester carboxylesterase